VWVNNTKKGISAPPPRYSLLFVLVQVTTAI
jgi:hypothetical protein